MKTKIIEQANHWINNETGFEDEMLVLENGMEEHDHCYSLLWFKKSERDLNWEQRTTYLGAGRLLISKDGKVSEFEGSAPGIDWIYHFENKLQDLESYWCLEIPYSRKNITKLKSVLKCSTTALLKKVNENNKITLTELKEWNDHYTELDEITNDLNNVGIDCLLKVKREKKSTNNRCIA